MEWDGYKLEKTIDGLNFVFFSEGPLGRIKKGIRLSRLRLYQMVIASFWPKVHHDFEVYGKIGRQWTSFQTGLNYEEFMILKKIQ